eukprot:TRINITY_DN179_c0_g2_i1.p2 TRINITY_DN179_c0_g2~~TRINITY_DN179_c0_g2_i1.p2  ORF type:complete len:249 (+),score=-1.98 TRINITY_DN179_c0_g2_i1:1548-2294(+)
MEKQLLFHATAKDVFTFAAGFVAFYRSHYEGDSSLLKKNVRQLEIENQLLEKVVCKLRKRKYTPELKQANDRLNQAFIALKMFVKANIHFPDQEISENGKLIWKLIEKHGSDLNRRGYASKISLLNALLANLKEEKFKVYADSLVGLEMSMLEMESAMDSLELLQEKSVSENVKRKEDVEATAHAKKMLRLINERIIPLLHVLYQMEPETYKALFTSSQEELHVINNSVRRRRKKWGKSEKNEGSGEE